MSMQQTELENGPVTKQKRATRKKPADAQTTAEPTPASAAPADVTPADEAPASTVDATPASATPADATPADATPADATPADATPADATPTDEAAAPSETERQRIEEQLAQLERKQAELRRALAIANHPTLGDAIREIEGRAYGVSRVEERLAQPLSKPEQRQRAKLEKKIEATKEKRRALDEQIAELEAQLAPLAQTRMESLRAEHHDAVRTLFAVLAKHSSALDEAGLQITALIPDLERWLPELRAMADEVAEA